MEILDQSVFNEVEETCWSNCTSAEMSEFLMLVFHINLACSSASPKDRPEMRRVAQDLLSIRDEVLLGTGTTCEHEKKIESSGNVPEIRRGIFSIQIKRVIRQLISV
jgi:hypothetical protein